MDTLQIQSHRTTLIALQKCRKWRDINQNTVCNRAFFSHLTQRH